MSNLKSLQPKSCQQITHLAALHESRHRKNTRGVNHALLQHLAAFRGGNLSLRDITEQFCVDFAEFLACRVASASARTYLNKLHALLEHAVSIHLLERNPMPAMHELMPRVLSPQRTYLTREDVARLNATPCRHSETKRAFLFACQTGLRLSDIETLMWQDIALINGALTIVKVQVKTGRPVRIPLNSIAVQLLGANSASGKVFNLMSRSVISTDLAAWARDTGIDKKLTFHVSRHTFATLSISAGVDIYVVSKLCGHSTVRTTEIYAHMIDSTLQQGVYLLGETMVRQHQRQSQERWLTRLLTKANGLLTKLRQRNDAFINKKSPQKTFLQRPLH